MVCRWATHTLTHTGKRECVCVRLKRVCICVRENQMRCGAAPSAYIGVSIAKSWAGSQNKRAEALSATPIFSTPPLWHKAV